MRRIVLITALLIAATAPAAGAAQPQVWATVNVCDTAAHPDQIGVRGSMGGLGTRAGMYMRFRVQYRDPSDGRWRYVTTADSRWRRAGTARNRALESGWSFELAGTGPQIVRGVVRFQWRRGGRVLRSKRRVTESGHRSTAGADPRDFSAATCRITH